MLLTEMEKKVRKLFDNILDFRIEKHKIKKSEKYKVYIEKKEHTHKYIEYGTQHMTPF